MKTTITKVFLDLDGCLCDFNSQFKTYSQSGLTFEEFILVNSKTRAWKIIHKAGISFWSEMPWMEDGKELFDHLKQTGLEIEILTAGVVHGACVEGKHIWCKNNLGDYKVNVVHAREKQNFGDENSILIDDAIRNMDQWWAKGKVGILHRNARETIKGLHYKLYPSALEELTAQAQELNMGY